MALTYLNCAATKVADLSPIKDMKLTTLYCQYTDISDLSLLKGMPLTRLNCGFTKVSDLSPLQSLPIENLGCDFKPERDGVILRPMWTLETINGKPTAEFWNEVGHPWFLEAELKRFLARWKDGTADREQLRIDVDAFRRRHPGAAEAMEAAALQAKLPSPLDNLDPKHIPAQERFDGQPKELVAVLGELRGRHGGAVGCVAYSRDGKWVASGGTNYVRFYDPATLRPLTTVGHESQVLRLVFSHDSRTLAVAGRGNASAGVDGTVCLWDMTGEKPKERFAFKVASSAVWGMDLSPDGTRLATGTGDGLARIWDITQGAPKQPLAVLAGHREPVGVLAYSPDGKRLATGGHDKLIRLWDLPDGKEPVEQAVLEGSSGTLLALAFTPDGRALVAGNHGENLCRWSVVAATRRREPTLEVRTLPVHSLAFAPKDRMLAAGCIDGSVRLLDPATLEERAVLKGHTGGWASVAFGPDGKTLVSGSGDWSVRLWDVAGPEPRERKPPRGHLSAPIRFAFSADGKMLASAGYAGRTIRFWDLTGVEPKQSAVLHDPEWGERVSALAFVRQGRALVVGCPNGNLELWDVATKQRLRRYDGGKGSIAALAAAPDGHSFLSGSADKTVQLWHVDKPKPIRSFVGHQERVNSVAFSPDGKRALSGAGDWAYHKDGSPVIKNGQWVPVDATVRLWEVETAKELLCLKGHEAYLHTVAFSPNGKQALSTAYHATMRLWDLEGAQAGQTVRLMVANGPCAATEFAPDGRTFATVDQLGVILWDAVSGKRLQEWRFGESLWPIALTPDGRHLAVSSPRGPMYILRLAAAAPPPRK
jgi:WD40 repeat protein